MIGQPKSVLRQRLDEAAEAVKVMETSGLKTVAITITPKRAKIALQNDSQHPRLNGVLCGQKSDSTGKWYVYETTVGAVVVRWQVSEKRARAQA